MGKEENPQEQFEDAFAEFTGEAPEKVEVTNLPERDEQGRFVAKEEKTEEVPQEAAEEVVEEVVEEATEEVVEEPEIDIWSGLNEQQENELKALQDERDQLDHWKKSQEGRIKAIQREYAAAPIQRERQEEPQINFEETSKRWKEFESDYPDIAAALDSKLNEAAQVFDYKLRSSLEPVQQSQKEVFVEKQFLELGQRHPDWEEVASSDSFRDWLGNQPDSMQQMYNSDYADDASALLDFYKAVHNSPPPAESEQVRVVKQKRKEQLQASAAIPNRTVQKSDDASDFDSAFEQAAKEIEERQRRYRTA